MSTGLDLALPDLLALSVCPVNGPLDCSCSKHPYSAAGTGVDGLTLDAGLLSSSASQALQGN